MYVETQKDKLYTYTIVVFSSHTSINRLSQSLEYSGVKAVLDPDKIRVNSTQDVNFPRKCDIFIRYS